MQVIHLIAARLDAFHTDMQEIKGTQKEMAAAFSRLVLMEERQVNATASIERCFKQQEKLEAKMAEHERSSREGVQAVERRVDTLEAAAPMLKQTSTWVIAGISGFIAFVAPKLFERLF